MLLSIRDLRVYISRRAVGGESHGGAGMNPDGSASSEPLSEAQVRQWLLDDIGRQLGAVEAQIAVVRQGLLDDIGRQLGAVEAQIAVVKKAVRRLPFDTFIYYNICSDESPTARLTSSLRRLSSKRSPSSPQGPSPTRWIPRALHGLLGSAARMLRAAQHLRGNDSTSHAPSAKTAPTLAAAKHSEVPA